MVRQHFHLDWAFSFTAALGSLVQAQFPTMVPSWPLIRQFDGKHYSWNDSHAIFVLTDKLSGIPSISGTWEDASPYPLPAFAPTANTASTWQDAMNSAFSCTYRDAAFVVPLTDGANLDDDWDNLFTKDDQDLWHRQLELVATRQYYHLKGFDVQGGFTLPPGYGHLADSCSKLFIDHPQFDRNVFIMTRFAPGNNALVEMDDLLRDKLKAVGLNGIRADDRVYPANRNLWDNVCTYMLCCRQGVAILESRGPDEFNPNVALEYGFMKALNRDVLLLKEVAFNKLVADVVGTLYETFDITDLPGTLEPAIDRWYRDLSNETR